MFQQTDTFTVTVGSKGIFEVENAVGGSEKRAERGKVGNENYNLPPSPSLTMRNWSADRPFRGVIKSINMRIDLRYDRESHAKMEIQSLERDVGP